ncbi:tRNA (adenosine(37)-N6)-threonylcarbamoyltransferase complex dimerization subunit type 1 TsaB [Adhaeribacter sp. BT258]|uniref:tRNA (Adenosine(37)-N6)-threonylcarbamoyltransferase complex dimerization subunit type 1 TsaB n=1 Tax=Adhaeribacter terrigena TaxID=2793070 RepID=A0ABS1C6E9_9BACT|nr:tRNA (adenosine(37)-N6)-threonylcarbamoyltransferase complex dimerization subunit type 1 TsaB [Adhaeribacter terrigena]MBK0404952.1 tRNA (adenosine(37)-N6)-threonylcarbamoyltransferase complex dimerization subunit type 1 TsaB [Adhaeribacter terrigena]
MALILSLETSSTVCSVALAQSGRLIGASELRLEKSHSSHITVLIQQLLENAGFTEKELSAVAVSGGPGSYTGLRIGTSTAKGLCYALNIPLIAISTLHALALQTIKFTANASEYLFCPMIDARRMEVYTALLTSSLQEVLPDQAKVLDETSFRKELENQKIIFFGNGAAKFEAIIGSVANAFFLKNVIPAAEAVSELAWQQYQVAQFEDVAYYEPFYVKEVHITAAKPKN